MRKVREITAEEENFRTVPFARSGMWTSRRDPVEPEPVGTIVAMIFRVTGYDPDCDGSLMARLQHVDRNGEPTGWEPHHLGLYPDTDIVLDSPGEIHRLAEQSDPTRPAPDTAARLLLGEVLAGLDRGEGLNPDWRESLAERIRAVLR